MKNPRLFVDVIRHGEPVGGARYRGHGIDDPLSEKGWRQMRAAVAGATVWDAVYSSPLRRCRAFAEAVAAERRLPLTIVDDFREVGFGRWEGHTKAELIARDAEAFAAFYRDPLRHRPPGAEPLADFLGRVRAAWQAMVAEAEGARVLVVAHAGVMRAILAGLLGLDAAAIYRVTIKNAGLMAVAYRDGEPHLEWVNRRRIDD